MKTVVVYYSVSGFAKRYAGWIADELKCDLYNVKDVSIKKLQEYETIIYGAGVHMMGIDNIKFIKNNLDKLKEKRIVVFATGMSEYGDKVMNQLKDKNFSEEELDHIKLFYLKGGFNYAKLNFKYRMMMKMVKGMMANKPEADRTPEEQNLLDSINNPTDFASKEDIKPIINYIRQ